MTSQPAGTVTLVFTDIEGSTKLLQELGQERYREALVVHREHVRSACARHSGYEVDYEGDSFFYSFASAQSALSAVSEAMQALAAGPIRIRVGIHTGEPGLDPPKYVGLDVHQAARIMGAGHGGQVLVSASTKAALPEDGFALKPLGEYRLKDLLAPEPLYQLELEGLAGEFPPLKALYNASLPTQPSPLVGRERELAELGELLGSTRLLTLTGPGGTGKTRLALQLAAETVERFPAGAHFVPLAPLSEPGLVASAVASVLGVQEQAGSTLEDSLLSHLRERTLLLLVDNLEHLLQAAPLLAQLLEAAPGLKILATSRERLNLRGEREYAVPPLAQPEAVALFAERAAALRAGFSLEQERDAVEAIVERLDRLPLAIELAAARVKLLPPAKLLARLEQRLPLLTGGARDLPERQRTLRATIEWSYELLAPEEQRLFRRLAVFAGGFALEAAEEICAAELDTLASLVDKSLVRANESAEGEGRFFLLETIREYAGEVLEASGEAEELQRRHAEWYADLAKAAQEGLRKTPDTRLLERLEREHDNLRSALAFTRDAEHRELHGALATSLYEFWAYGAHCTEGRGCLEPIAANAAVARSTRAQAHLGVAWLAQQQGDYDALAHATESTLQLLDPSGDGRWRAHALGWRAQVLSHRHECDSAIRAFQESIRLAEEAGDSVCLCASMNNLATTYNSLGQPQAALPLFERSLELDRKTGNRFGEMVGLVNLSETYRLMGARAEAAPFLCRALSLCCEIGWHSGAAHALLAASVLNAASGQLEAAARLLASSDSLLQEAEGGLAPSEERDRSNVLEALRDLADERVERRFAEGRALGFEEAIASALRTLDDLARAAPASP